jgi:hypothetical protein
MTVVVLGGDDDDDIDADEGDAVVVRVSDRKSATLIKRLILLVACVLVDAMSIMDTCCSNYRVTTL